MQAELLVIIIDRFTHGLLDNRLMVLRQVSYGCENVSLGMDGLCVENPFALALCSRNLGLRSVSWTMIICPSSLFYLFQVLAYVL